MIVMDKLIACQRCGVKYDWKKSNSALKMTYCRLGCEVGGLGFSLDALEKGQFERSGRIKINLDDIRPITQEDIDQLYESAGPSVASKYEYPDDDDRPRVPV